MRGRKFTIAIACGLALTVGCAGRRSVDTNQVNDLPLQPGTDWIYVLTDSSAGWTDTIRVQILSYDSGPTDTGTYWHVTIDDDHSWAPDQAYVQLGDSRVVRRGDSLQFYDERPGSPPYLVILLPLAVGNGWRIAGSGVSDTATVIGVESVTTPAGTFEDAFRVERMVSTADCGWAITVWMTPAVGVLKVRSATVGEVCYGGISTWELSAYRLP